MVGGKQELPALFWPLHPISLLFTPHHQLVAGPRQSVSLSAGPTGILPLCQPRMNGVPCPLRVSGKARRGAGEKQKDSDCGGSQKLRRWPAADRVCRTLLMCLDAARLHCTAHLTLVLLLIPTGGRGQVHLGRAGRRSGKQASPRHALAPDSAWLVSSLDEMQGRGRRGEEVRVRRVTQSYQDRAERMSCHVKVARRSHALLLTLTSCDHASTRTQER